jgi:hypothetical protein
MRLIEQVCDEQARRAAVSTLEKDMGLDLIPVQMLEVESLAGDEQKVLSMRT